MRVSEHSRRFSELITLFTELGTPIPEKSGLCSSFKAEERKVEHK